MEEKAFRAVTINDKIIEELDYNPENHSLCKSEDELSTNFSETDPMDTPAVEVNNHCSLKVTTSILIATLSPIAITIIVTDNIPTSSSLVGKIINPSAYASKVSNNVKNLLMKACISKMEKGLILKLVIKMNIQRIN